MLNIHERDGALVVAVRVQPRASRDEVVGEKDGALKVRLQAPAVENRANDALCEYLAALLKTPKTAVRILSRDRNRSKHCENREVTPQHRLALLTRACL